MGRSAELAPAVGALEEFFSAEVGLKPPDVPKAMALVLSESIEHPDEMRELARAGWVPREAEGWAALSYLGRGRLGAWVASAQGGGGHGEAAARAAVEPAAQLWNPRPRRSSPKKPARKALADPSMVDDEARCFLHRNLVVFSLSFV